MYAQPATAPPVVATRAGPGDCLWLVLVLAERFVAADGSRYTSPRTRPRRPSRPRSRTTPKPRRKRCRVHDSLPKLAPKAEFDDVTISASGIDVGNQLATRADRVRGSSTCTTVCG